MVRNVEPPRIRTEFPHEVRVIENTWISMPDGCRLAATIWLPVDAETNPVPAILEYLPYRKDDWTAAHNALVHPYFAGHGYAAVRVDLRGSGSSDGILYDEYLPQEQTDAVEVIAWLAAQPWCTGAVGMIGASWGGFNGLQVAARRPPALRAIVTMYSTDDRYADDVHYMGGCVIPIEMLPWATTMLAYNARPPLPSVVGERWRAMWHDRLKQTPPFIETWLGHQRRDAYWQQGSVCEDFDAIACAVYAVGGWADGYTNAVPRLLAGLRSPKKGLIGPWGHIWPYVAKPGPAIGFLQECLRWWDHWLKGIDTGIMGEPLLRAWMVESHAPSASYEEWPGRWVAESAWPPQVEPQTFALNARGLDATPTAEVELTIRGKQITGRDAGIWCPTGAPGDFPLDQRAEDGLSLTFTSAPLEQPLEILGFPEVTLTCASDCPNALVAVRLCDVAPQGASTLITRGLLNLTHRHGHESPEPLVPGQRYTVTIRLNAIGWVAPAGHRLRVAVSPTYWPWAWPSPEPVTLTIFTGGTSTLVLPIRQPRPDDQALRPFAPPESATPVVESEPTLPGSPMTTDHNVVTGFFQQRFTEVGARHSRDPGGPGAYSSHADIMRIHEDDPLSATVRTERTFQLTEGDWSTRVEATGTMTGDHDSFHVTHELNAYEGNTRVFAESWVFTIPRDHV